MFKKSGLILLSLMVVVVVVSVSAAAASDFSETDSSGESVVMVANNGQKERVRTVAVFRGQDQMLKYLNYINQYYAVRGRARFGKRAED